MNAVNIEDMFEECVRQLSAGSGLEEVLAKFPDQAEELRPMLQAALDLQRFAADIKPSQAAQMRSRAQFLTAAAGMAATSSKRGSKFNPFHWRLAASSAILVAIIAAIFVLGTGFASADALPGDVFYPVKIMVEQMQINLVQDAPARLEMEEGYDDRRQEEVARLTKMQRRQEVKFSGFLRYGGAGQWKIGSVLVKFPAGGPNPADFEDAYVEIVGQSDNEMVEVQSIALHRLEWEGVLQKFDDQSWLISGLSIRITEETEISGSLPQIGAVVRVVATRPTGSQYAAISLNVKSLPSTAINPLPKPSQTLEQEGGESKESGENNSPTSEPKEATPTARPQSKPTEVKSTEEENKSKPQATMTPTKKDSDERPRATRTPTRVPDPTGNSKDKD